MVKLLLMVIPRMSFVQLEGYSYRQSRTILRVAVAGKSESSRWMADTSKSFPVVPQLKAGTLAPALYWANKSSVVGLDCRLKSRCE